MNNLESNVKLIKKICYLILKYYYKCFKVTIVTKKVIVLIFLISLITCELLQNYYYYFKEHGIPKFKHPSMNIKCASKNDKERKVQRHQIYKQDKNTIQMNKRGKRRVFDDLYVRLGNTHTYIYNN